MAMIPTIGLTGRFGFKAPYNSADDQLTVVALRTLGELQQRGIDAYQEYYVLVGLVNSNTVNSEVFSWEAERERSPVIVYFQNSVGQIKAVPSTYIVDMPKAGMVPYVNKHLVLTLGAYETQYPLSQLVDDLVDRATYLTGQMVNGQLVTTPISPALSQATIDDLVQVRKAHYVAHPTVFAELTQTKAELAETKALVETLSNVLRRHNLLT